MVKFHFRYESVVSPSSYLVCILLTVSASELELDRKGQNTSSRVIDSFICSVQYKGDIAYGDRNLGSGTKMPRFLLLST